MSDKLHLGDDLDQLFADAALSLDGRGADVRRAGDHRVGVERNVGRGLVGIDVQTGGADLAAVERVKKRSLVDVGAAGGVDDDDAVLHLGDALSVDESAAVDSGSVDGDEVGLGEQLVHLNIGDAELFLDAGDVEDIEGDDVHADGLGHDAEVLADAVTYIRIYFGGVLFSVVYNMTAGILNAAGNSRRSLVYLAWASVTNIVLDFVFIVGLRMGVAGAAIATDLSQLVSCVLSLRFLMKSEDACRVELSAIRLHRKMAGRIIRVGLPTGIQNMVISFSNVLVQASVNSYGAAAMAGFAAYMKIDGFNILPVSSISMAATTFVGQNYGAGRLDRVKRSVWVTLAIGVIYTLCTGAALLAGQDAILHLFTADEAVVTYGKLAMRWFCPFYFLLSILHGLAGAVRGTGASIPPMVVLLVSLCLFRVVWIQFLLPFFSGIEGVFILYPVSWGLGALLMILYAWKGKWMEYHT